MVGDPEQTDDVHRPWLLLIPEPPITSQGRSPDSTSQAEIVEGADLGIAGSRRPLLMLLTLGHRLPIGGSDGGPGSRAVSWSSRARQQAEPSAIASAASAVPATAHWPSEEGLEMHTAHKPDPTRRPPGTDPQAAGIPKRASRVDAG